ncbi:lines N-terminus-domain-containing protein [Phascolomyces articulosus]|uniref:Lines N-terminus-domain-containing protein n=1 Tax=Phascolomyces articulosus TaxID=60185 RepID=A0AAD5K1A5_9FUNG|nr:lines N-terminus-domain-containing protein [Phascolomyces articulosus]
MTDNNINESLDTLIQSQSPHLALHLLQEVPWDRLFHQTDDPFQVYTTARLLQYIMILNNTTEKSAQYELNQGRRVWITQLIEKMTMEHHHQWTCATPIYLELCHTILKDYRKHSNDMSDRNEDEDHHVGWTLLSTCIRDRNVCAWIQNALNTKSGMDCVPLIVLMTDIAKTCKSWMEQDNNASQEGWLWMSRHLSQICTLWLDPHITVARRSLALVGILLRYYKRFEMIQTVLPFFVSYTKTLYQHLTRQQLYSLCDPDRTEFFYSTVGDHPKEDDDDMVDKNCLAVDRECLKQATQIFFIILAALMDISLAQENKDKNKILNNSLHELINITTMLYQEAGDILEILFELHGNNDEDAINLQLDILNMYEKLDYSLGESNSENMIMIKHLLNTTGIGPNCLFLFFCRRTGMDHSLLVDLLLSNETEFLLFFVRYLKYIERDPQDFVQVCHTLVEDQEEVMDMFRGVLTVLQSGGFPYNPNYLIKRLAHVIKILK